MVRAEDWSSGTLEMLSDKGEWKTEKDGQQIAAVLLRFPWV